MRTYAAYIKDSDLLYHSSSGGMFLAASMAILSQGGYIVASEYEVDTQSVQYQVYSKFEDVKKASGSKYIQSDSSNMIQSVLNIVKHDM